MIYNNEYANIEKNEETLKNLFLQKKGNLRNKIPVHFLKQCFLILQN